MNALTRDLEKLTAQAESMAPDHQKFRQKFHLMPPVGWLNDPNGLCQFQGIYHFFFQYSPFDVNGGAKLWGHSTSTDMVHWEYQGACLYPDQPFDCNGVYSGSAFLEDGTMYLYYTGNVKLEDGDYDYIHSGREGNTVLVASQDGVHFGPKRLLMRNSDYPSDLSCHVRDPKVWRQNSRYYMLQGARTRNDVGQALLFVSNDKVNWTFMKRIQTPAPFGYMWECPDYLQVDGQNFLSASVQGLEGEPWTNRNVYQSGYFPVTGDLPDDYQLGNYQLWDYGFDYYAPQSFITEDKRTILTAWMGMADCLEYGNSPTVQEGWQHCFTFPRELQMRDGRLCQIPARELDSYFQKATLAQGELSSQNCPVYLADIQNIRQNQFCAVLCDDLILEYRQGRFEMRFTSHSKDGISGGRHLRYLDMDRLENVKILADVSSVEVFLNNGQAVFSTRYYPNAYSLDIHADGAKIQMHFPTKL